MPAAYYLVAPRTFELREYEEPPLGPREARLQSVLSGISHGTELNLYRGSAPFADKYFDREHRLFMPNPTPGFRPLILGYEMVSQVVEVGRYVLVHPKEGTQGSEISITGTGFGLKKGKVLLGNAALKVLEWSDSTIRCLLTKVAPTGTYPITIAPKGLSPIVEEEAFAVRGPVITEVLPEEGSTGDEVVVRGLYFGSKKGKILLGTKSCKVLSWTMESDTGEGEVRFLVPKGLLPGAYDLKLMAKTGEMALAEDGFRVK